ncbi:MAG: DUF4194 domain-containing protein [Leptospiraceae bacterium]|nr:DUF4194 domain-containing protein [Leptospiraceae bacterium]
MNNKLLPYTNVIIKLLQGIIYLDDKEWNELKKYTDEIKKHFNSLGLALYFDEIEGFSFLKQMEFSEDETPPLKLISKRQLTFSVTMICVVLREQLMQFDSSSSETGKLILSKEEIVNLVNSFYKEDTSNEAKKLDKINSDINKLIEYGFLKWFNESKNLLEVKRIIRAIIDADKLNEIKEKLLEYAKRNV